MLASSNNAVGRGSSCPLTTCGKEMTSSEGALPIAEALYLQGRITAREMQAAQRWLSDVQFAEIGKVMPLISVRADGESGNIHTWMLGRSRAIARLKALLRQFGHPLFHKLEWMLIEERSISRMEKLLYPSSETVDVREKTISSCVEELEKLTWFYKNRKTILDV